MRALQILYKVGRLKTPLQTSANLKCEHLIPEWHFPRVSAPEPPDDWGDMVDDWPTLAAWERKRRDALVERHCLENFFSEQPTFPVETNELFGACAPTLCSSYGFTELPLHLADFREFVNPLSFMDVLINMKQDSHPGFPYVLLASSKGECLEHHFTHLYHAFIQRVVAMFRSDGSGDPIELVRGGLIDPHCILLKGEVAKVGKDCRIIQIVSIVDSAIDRLLFHALYKKVLCRIDCGSGLGITFSALDADCIHDRFAGRRVLSTDVPKFDRTVQYEEDLAIAHGLFNTYDPPAPPWAHHLAMVRVRVKHKKAFLLSDGLLFHQTKPGVRATGEDGTSSLNTLVRQCRSEVAHAANFQVPLYLAAGDDCDEAQIPGFDLLAAYCSLGYPLRDATLCPEGRIDFCSHVFERGKDPYPVRLDKGLASILLKPDVSNVDRIAFADEFCDHPSFHEAAQMLRKYRPGELTYCVRQRTMSVKRGPPTLKQFLANQKERSNVLVVTAPKSNRPKGKRGKKSRKLPPMVRGVSNLVHDACSLLDPFCKHAYGARGPNVAGATTIPLTARSFVALSTSTAEATSFFLYPHWNQGYKSNVVSVGGVTTIPTPDQISIGGSTPAVYLINGRLNSCGIIIRNTTKNLDVAGTILCTPLARYSAADTFSGPPFMQDPNSFSAAATKNMEIAIVPRRRGAESYLFSPNTIPTDQPEFQPWVCYFPPTSVVNTYEIEVVFHVEGYPLLTQQILVAASSGRNKSASPQAVSIVDRIGSMVPSSIRSTAGNAATEFGKRMVNAAAALATNAAVTYMTGSPAAGGVAALGAGKGMGMIMDVD